MLQESADKHAEHDLSTVKELIALGAPVSVAANTHDGALTGLIQAANGNTQSPGAVPSMLHLNLGDKVVGIPMSFFTQNYDAQNAALAKINRMRTLEGGSQLNQADFRAMPKDLQSQTIADA